MSLSSSAKFLGNHLLSYGQHLTLSFTAESRELLPKIVTMVLEGSGLSVSADVFSTQYEESETSQIPHNIFTLRLTETEVNPSLTPFEFRHLLSNMTALHISNVGGQNYTSQLSGVTLTSATLAESYSDTPLTRPAPWVEVCTCPLGFMGQFCELCAPGFTRDRPNGGPYSPCIPCECNQHGTCHPETGL
ncbi:laminin subunit gamma-3 [Tachysurus ichikawai]